MEGADVAGAQLDQREVGGRVLRAVHEPYEQDGEGHEHERDRGDQHPLRFSAAHGLTLQSHLMLFTEIDHVAIAVNDLEAAIDYYAATYGCEVEHREVVESDGVEEALLKVADSYVQLLTPTRDDSPVAKYLEKKGEGLHHIGYRVDDCAAAREPGDDGRVHPPEDGVRDADRARPGELTRHDRVGRRNRCREPVPFFR